jgi:hypothetical protein
MSLSIIPGVRSGELARALEWQEATLDFTITPGASGSVETLLPQIMQAQSKLIVAIAGSADNSALAGLIPASGVLELVSDTAPYTAEEVAVATLVRPYLLAPAAIAAGSRSIVFAMGGLGAKQIRKAELTWNDVGAGGTNSQRVLIERSAATLVSPSGAAAATISPTGTPLVAIQDVGILLGAFAIPASGTLPTSGSTCSLTVWYQN